MAEELTVQGQTRREKYEVLLPQIEALVNGETDLVANLANVSSALKMTFNFFWVGFYWVKDDELVLGPFQGSLACTRIAKGKGVCGTAWETGKSQLVKDVDAFPGHIACSSMSKSEVVIPVFRQGEVIGVLDVDSDLLADFDEIDVQYLEKLCQWLGENLAV